ncbi:hypothetical protein PAXRUDRAFT_834197 [Paxillus rubicundulus Ve08.2h10]|uniref:Peptidase C14 caspase domain-containing protein n=1 Tax=Paxillus rubicundulus Ve08.2h10 TaxID=930991 RepID=A0A0D0DLN1_9AGAM|nr:hypothetical protein PAXRUDRAFT_834197 [Paxillus rubicundulus Ve08.2h10]
MMWDVRGNPAAQHRPLSPNPHFPVPRPGIPSETAQAPSAYPVPFFPLGLPSAPPPRKATPIPNPSYNTFPRSFPQSLSPTIPAPQNPFGPRPMPPPHHPQANDPLQYQSSSRHHSHRRTHHHSQSASTAVTRHVHYAKDGAQPRPTISQPRPTLSQPQPTLSQGSHVFPTAQAPPPLRRAMSSTHLHSNAPTATQTRQLSQPSHGHRQRVHSTGNAPAPRIMNAAPSQSHQQIPVHGNGNCEYSKCTGRKKALCIGINYKGQRRELRGCVNDIKNVRRFLRSQWGFKDGDIVMLMDETANPRQMPTRTNMIDAMRWLVKDARPHDSLFFHYSGHGGQIPDKDGDEIDGFDEVIYPVDYKKTGVILDDEMHRIMVKSLPQGCRLTAVFDVRTCTVPVTGI